VGAGCRLYKVRVDGRGVSEFDRRHKPHLEMLPLGGFGGHGAIICRPTERVEFGLVKRKKPPRSWSFRGHDQTRVSSNGKHDGNTALGR
jgi:hypothetical protein